MKHSPLDELKEAKAKQDSILERLAAKRRQRHNLLAGMTMTGTLKFRPNAALSKVMKKTHSSVKPTLPDSALTSTIPEANRTNESALPGTKDIISGKLKFLCPQLSLTIFALMLFPPSRTHI
ncbi:unnamed protein product [Echinostoma caproni]|uniref:Uncharacterized protein n=1 Tax=Echinostoma caproni TaxID=27848 RepID=A0A183BDX3_9TREM|nr:unnamed protein product [Echinostoma caproni]